MVYAPCEHGEKESHIVVDDRGWAVLNFADQPLLCEGGRPLGTVEDIERALKLLHLLETADEWVPKDRGYTADEIGEMLGVGPSRSDQIVAAYDNAERGWKCTVANLMMSEPMGDCVPPPYDEQHAGCGWVRLVPEIGDTDE